MEDCHQQAVREGLFQPIRNSATTAFQSSGDEQEEGRTIYPCLLNLEIPTNSNAIQQKVAAVDGTEFLVLQSSSSSTQISSMDDDEEEEEEERRDDGNDDRYPPITLLHPGGQYQYHALVIPSSEETRGDVEQSGSNNDDNMEEEGYYKVQLLVQLVGTEDHFREIACYDSQVVKNLVFENVVFEGIVKSVQQNQTMVEGVVIVDDAIGENLRATLNGHIQALANAQARQGFVDYHPHSKDIVRDLVHPGLYSYVQDVTPLRAQVQDVDPCIFPNADLTPSSQEDGKDFWGRPYEISKYQWLPTYVTVGRDGHCLFEDYINNLSPRLGGEDNGPLYDSLARLLEECLPYMESVYSFVHAIRPHFREEGEMDWRDGEELRKLKLNPISFRGQRLQVIPKIVDYELKPGQTYDGVWHVEGMSHEEIVLTALYILDRDEDIQGGSIAFQRAFLRDEATYVFSNVFSNINQFRPSSVETFTDKGLIPLGRVETPKGRLIVFPNSHVHRVQEMIHQQIGRDDEHAETSNIARRRIVVFFLVNPMHRIVSTREVAPQQKGTMSYDEALAHRLALMEERKYHKQDWNVREIELCEH
jgi:hypothetical protein